MDQLDVRPRPALGERHPECVEDEVGAHVVGELPADDSAAVDVDHEREEDDALPAAQVGEIDAPELVRAGCLELALDEISRPRRRPVRGRRTPRLAAPFGALNAVCAHQPLDLAAPDLLAGAPERLPHPPRPVGEVVALMDLPDQLEQPLVLDPTGRQLTGRSVVVGGRRHAQGLADRLDPEAAALLVDEGAHLGRCGSSSPAKNTARGLQDLVRPAQLEPPHAAASGSPHAPPCSTDQAADPRSPRPDAGTSAASRTATRDQQRRARSGGPTRTPAASHAPATPPGTSSLSASQTSPSSRADALPSKSPSNPGWLNTEMLTLALTGLAHIPHTFPQLTKGVTGSLPWEDGLVDRYVEFLEAFVGRR